MAKYTVTLTNKATKTMDAASYVHREGFTTFYRNMGNSDMAIATYPNAQILSIELEGGVETQGR